MLRSPRPNISRKRVNRLRAGNAAVEIAVFQERMHPESYSRHASLNLLLTQVKQRLIVHSAKLTLVTEIGRTMRLVVQHLETMRRVGSPT